LNPARLPASEDLRYWLALHRAPLVGSRRFGALLARFSTPRAVFEVDQSEWLALGLAEPTLTFLRDPDWRAVENDLQWLEGDERHCLTLAHPQYPSLLREIADPPPVLFVEGRPQALALRHIAVVGSRNPSPTGLKAAREFAGGLVLGGFGIVSGLALGIDAAAHRGALATGGITIAVVGAGPDRIYPRQHRTLVAELVAGGGALVSEFPPGTEPKAGHFPRRNRIISGLSLGTLVVEAAVRSGSLITARLAAEQNREVFAVPGSIYSPLAQGCNDLIQQGAKLVQTVADVIEEFEGRVTVESGRGPANARPERESPHLTLLKYIAYDPTSVDTLVAATGNSAETVTSQLLLLELEGYVASTPGGCYVRVS
jgi:DNA processing protein